jgi:VIT1/CCC1 family predicted Fe2+/Mn2+ transporter
MQEENWDKLLETASKIQDRFEVEIYATPRNRKAKIISALYVGLAFFLLGLLVYLPEWYLRLPCAAVYILAAFAFDRESRIRWR